MSRNDLLENNYHFKIKEPKKAVITVMWILLFILVIALNTLFFILAKIGVEFDLDDIEYYDVVISNVIFAAIPFIYFFFKIKMTSRFCSDRQSVTMKVLEDGCLVCACREALKVRQIILAHLIPAVSMLAVLLSLNLLTELGGTYAILVVFMSFFIAFDLTLVIYLLFMKERHKVDYISINKHVYNMTLYAKNYQP